MFKRITRCRILLGVKAASPKYGEEVNEGPEVKGKNNGEKENKDDREMRKRRIRSRRKMMKRKRLDYRCCEGYDGSEREFV